MSRPASEPAGGRGGPAVYPRWVSRFNAWSLLAVFGIGVFLAGLELMITATALPSILQDLAVSDQLGKPAFSELRHASWIVNGYLLAYVVAMPLAGRLADVWGARRLFLSALDRLHPRLGRGRPRPVDRRADRRHGSSRASAAAILVPVGTAAASHLFEGDDRPRALGIIGALTFLGMAAGPFLGAAILGGLDVGERDRAGRRGPGSDLANALVPSWRWVFYVNVPIGIVALLDRLGGLERLGDAPPPGRDRHRRRRRSGASPGGGPRRGDADRRVGPRRAGPGPGRPGPRGHLRVAASS